MRGSRRRALDHGRWQRGVLAMAKRALVPREARVAALQIRGEARRVSCALIVRAPIGGSSPWGTWACRVWGAYARY